MVDATTSVAERIKALKVFRSKAILANRREVYNEAAGAKEKVLEKRKLQKKLDEDEEELGFKPADIAMKSNLKDLEYTAEETEKWMVLRGWREFKGQGADSDKSELQNFKQLAERTYMKNVKELKEEKLKSKEDYVKEKEQYLELKSKGLSEEEIRSGATSTQNLQQYAKKIEKWENQVYRKRQKLRESGVGDAIHEKNRQFNNKLDRHYDRMK